jgi:hypothetical protein
MTIFRGISIRLTLVLVLFALAPAMTVSAPAMTAGGRLAAALAAQVDLQEMNAIIQLRTADRQTDDAHLVNTSSWYVTQPRQSADLAVLSRGPASPPRTGRDPAGSTGDRAW